MNKDLWLVYKHKNKINNKVYIGITSKSTKQRWGANGKGYQKGTYFRNAIDKYGWDSFEHKVLYKNLSREDAIFKEKYLIKLFQSNNKIYGYNSTSGGDGVENLSEESREKISIGESRRQIAQFDLNGKLLNIYRNPHKAKDYFKDNGIKISDKNIMMCCSKYYGRKTQGGFIWMYYDDFLKNGINLSDYKRDKKVKRIHQYDIKGNFIREYESAREVERQTGISYKYVSRICNGERLQYKGYVFRFKEDDFNKFKVVAQKPIRKIIQMDLSGNFVKQWDNIIQAEKYGFTQAGIASCCKGKRKMYKSFIWKYADDF